MNHAGGNVAKAIRDRARITLPRRRRPRLLKDRVGTSRPDRDFPRTSSGRLKRRKSRNPVWRLRLRSLGRAARRAPYPETSATPARNVHRADGASAVFHPAGSRDANSGGRSLTAARWYSFSSEEGISHCAIQGLPAKLMAMSDRFLMLRECHDMTDPAFMRGLCAGSCR